MGNCNSSGKRRACDPCNPTYRPGSECSVYSSQVIYDGMSHPELDIRNGDGLNDVIESLTRKLSSVSDATSSIQRDTFRGVKAVRLRYEPLSILSVTYCNVNVPSDGYVVNGRTMKFMKKYCFGDDTTEVNVLYTTRNSNILTTGCYE